MKTTYIRASSLARLFDCAHAWEGVHLLGMASQAGMRAWLGTSIHHGTAEFDRAKSAGKPITILDATDAYVEKLRNPDQDISLSIDDLSPREAEKIGINLVSMYCHDWSPKYQFSAIEMTVEPMEIDCGGGISITLTGTLDRSRVVKGRGGEAIADIKTGSRAVQNGAASIKGRAPQVGVYELLYEHTTGKTITHPAEIIGMQTSGSPKIATATIPNARRVLLGQDGYPGLLEHAAQMFRTGLFPPNPSSGLCSPKYCPRWNGCIFHE